MSRLARGLLVALVLLAGVGTSLAEKKVRRWEVTFDVRIVPTEGVAHVTVRLGGYASLVEYLRFRTDPERHSAFEGDGKIVEDPPYVRWEPPSEGGELRYVFRIDHLRDNARYDARVTPRWALFRGDDLVPPARIASKDDAPSRSRLRFRLPKGWSVATPYQRLASGEFEVEHPHRIFDRPTGWMVAGRLGVLREKIAGTWVAVAGPIGQGLHRNDLLAFMRWTLPTMKRIIGSLPERLLIVGAGDPMWRGGLSGPRSLFVHAERPLITADLTSPILHEILHVAMGARAGDDGDWIVEGMAEYFSLETLVRSRTVSQRRHERALARLEARGRTVRKLRVPSADGDVTARAVTVLGLLDTRMRELTGDRVSLDDAAARLAQLRLPVTTERFRRVVEKLTDRDFSSFFRRYVR